MKLLQLKLTIHRLHFLSKLTTPFVLPRGPPYYIPTTYCNDLIGKSGLDLLSFNSTTHPGSFVSRVSPHPVLANRVDNFFARG